MEEIIKKVGKLKKSNDNAINGYLHCSYASCYSNLLRDKNRVIEDQQNELYTFAATSKKYLNVLQNKIKNKLHKKPSIKSINSVKNLLTQFTYKA